ncbi:MAG TPA: CPBP family intramembrane glutamic endopeptidase [Planctomycetota bacterium]
MDGRSQRLQAEDVRIAPWWVTVVASGGYGFLLVAANSLWAGPVLEALGQVQHATAGLLPARFLMSLAAFAFLAVVIFWIARLKPADVGWHASALAPALGITLLCWALMQVGLCILAFALRDRPALTATDSGLLRLVLPMATDLLGNSWLEETFFRGYLLQQLFRRMVLRCSRRAAWWCAALGALLLFVLAHVPRFIGSPEDLPAGVGLAVLWAACFGGLLTVVFLVTGNLFLCVGLHALHNARPMLLAAPWQRVEIMWWVVTLAVILVWSVNEARKRARAARTGTGAHAPASQESVRDMA